MQVFKIPVFVDGELVFLGHLFVFFLARNCALSYFRHLFLVLLFLFLLVFFSSKFCFFFVLFCFFLYFSFLGILDFCWIFLLL